MFYIHIYTNSTHECILAANGTSFWFGFCTKAVQCKCIRGLPIYIYIYGFKTINYTRTSDTIAVSLYTLSSPVNLKLLLIITRTRLTNRLLAACTHTHTSLSVHLCARYRSCTGLPADDGVIITSVFRGEKNHNNKSRCEKKNSDQLSNDC